MKQPVSKRRTATAVRSTKAVVRPGIGPSVKQLIPGLEPTTRNVKLALTNLTLADRAQDTLGPRAEPYILFTFFKIDGVFIRVPVT